MKQSTQDRLISDAMLAADGWQKDAVAWRDEARSVYKKYVRVTTAQPFIFISGMLTATLGILLFAQVFV